MSTISNFANIGSFVYTDANGNVGLGSYPSNWSSLGNVIEHNKFGFTGIYGGDTYIGNNTYFNGTNWISITSNPNAIYQQAGGYHRFYSTTSGTTGAVAAFNNTLTIDPSGRVTMPYQPAFSAYGTSANFSVSTTPVVVPFNTVNLNTGNNYNNSTYTFTAPVSGLYYLSFSVLIYPTSIPTGVFMTVYPSINGSGFWAAAPIARKENADQQNTMGNSYALYLNSGDSVRLMASVSSGTYSLYLQTGHAMFNMYLIR